MAPKKPAQKKKAKKQTSSKPKQITTKAPTSKPVRRNALGRGLNALMAANVQPVAEEVSVNDWREPGLEAKPEVETKLEQEPLQREAIAQLDQATQLEGAPEEPKVSRVDEDQASEQLAQLKARLGKGLAKEVARDFKLQRAEEASFATTGENQGSESLKYQQLEEQKPDLRIVPDEDESQVQAGEGFAYLDIESLAPCADQPRKHFEPSELEALAASIKESGLIQPLLVRPVDSSGQAKTAYEIVAGERRFRAAQAAGLKKLPVHVRELSEREAFELAIVENVQREDLDPVEEARAYQRLADEFQETQADIAKAVGKERATVANMMRLLQLPEEVLTLLQKGKISTGHARAILMAPERLRLKFAQRVVAEKLSVRATEALASGKTPAVKTKSPGKGTEGTVIRSPAVIDLENRIRSKLGTKVKLEVSGEGDAQKGELKISFFSRAELESLIEKLGA